MDGGSAAVLAVLPKAASAIISAATSPEGQLSAAQPAVLALLLEHLPVLPAVQQPLLFRRLLPLAAAIPAAAQRTRGLARLWSAVLRYDWAAAGGGRGGRGGNAAQAGPPPSQLQALLLEPGVKDAVSGQPGSGDVGAALTAAAAAADAPPVFPAYREELVGSLLYVLLSHPRGTAAAGSGEAGARGASSLLAEASETQSLVEGAEWLASAKTALQVRAPAAGFARAGSLPLAFPRLPLLQPGWTPGSPCTWPLSSPKLPPNLVAHSREQPLHTSLPPPSAPPPAGH
jgi:hypothetical protein